MNKVYFIGAGPGDAEFFTLKGARLLSGCRTVFAPTPFEVTFSEYLKNKKILIPFDYYFSELLDLIGEGLAQGDVGFLVPGDLTFYSPFQALIDALGDVAEVIPGVGTVNAASALLKKTLDLPGVCNRALLVSPRTLGDGEDAPTLDQMAAPGVSLLIYMNNLPLPELVEQLRRGYGRNVPIVLAHRIGLPGQEMIQGTLDDIVAIVGDRDYFNLKEKTRKPALTLVLVGETLEARADGAWWDFRRENIWRYREGDTP